MECADLRAAILRGETPEGSDVDAHVSGCAPCAELIAEGARLGRGLGAGDPPNDDVDALLANVHRDVERERGARAWLQSRATGLRLALGLAAAGVIVLAQLAVSRRVDLEVYPLHVLLAAATTQILFTGAALAAALRPLQLPGLGWRAGAALIAGALALPLFLAALPPAHLDHAASLVGAGDELMRRAVSCFTYGAALAFPLVALLRILDRGEHRSLLAAILAAAGAGLAANLALLMHCPITHSEHLLLGHATIGIALTIVYAGVTRAASKFRS